MATDESSELPAPTPPRETTTAIQQRGDPAAGGFSGVEEAAGRIVAAAQSIHQQQGLERAALKSRGKRLSVDYGDASKSALVLYKEFHLQKANEARKQTKRSQRDADHHTKQARWAYDQIRNYKAADAYDDKTDEEMPQLLPVSPNGQ